jgi:hypothetical protein
MPLSTAALLSARFTYVSPAALINTHDLRRPSWLRLVDGGYFDNSGAVTAQEIARALLRSGLSCEIRGGAANASPCMRLIVLYLPNEPVPPSALLSSEKQQSGRFEVMSEVFAPVQTLLNTRGARGTQAVSFLHGEPAVSLLTLRPCTEHVTAPLGWVLSKQVRDEMRAQLGACRSASGEGNCAGAKIRWAAQLVNESAESPLPSAFERPTDCPPPERP